LEDEDAEKTPPVDPRKLVELRSRSDPAIDTKEGDAQNPMWVQGGQSWAFWNMASRSSQQLKPPRPELNNRQSSISALSSEEDDAEGDGETTGAEEEVRCKSCGGSSFKLRVVRVEGREEKRVVCTACGASV